MFYVLCLPYLFMNFCLHQLWKIFSYFSTNVAFYTVSLVLGMGDLRNYTVYYYDLHVFDLYTKFSSRIISSNLLSALPISFWQSLVCCLDYLLSIILTNLFFIKKFLFVSFSKFGNFDFFFLAHFFPHFISLNISNSCFLDLLLPISELFDSCC